MGSSSPHFAYLLGLCCCCCITVFLFPMGVRYPGGRHALIQFPKYPSSVSQTHNPGAHETNQPSRPVAQGHEPKEGRARFPSSTVGVSYTWSLHSQCPLHLSARKSVLSEDRALSPAGRNSDLVQGSRLHRELESRMGKPRWEPVRGRY